MRELSPRQLQQFSLVVDGLITMDQKIDLFEWSIQKVVFNHLNLEEKSISHNPHGSSALAGQVSTCSVFLAALAHYGGEQMNAEDAFNRGVKLLNPKNTIQLPTIESCTIEELEKSLPRLQKLSASAKRTFLTACLATAEHDQQISETEFLILRGLAAAISCPLGPTFINPT